MLVELLNSSFGLMGLGQGSAKPLDRLLRLKIRSLIDWIAFDAVLDLFYCLRLCLEATGGSVLLDSLALVWGGHSGVECVYCWLYRPRFLL